MSDLSFMLPGLAEPAEIRVAGSVLAHIRAGRALDASQSPARGTPRCSSTCSGVLGSRHDADPAPVRAKRDYVSVPCSRTAVDAATRTVIALVTGGGT